MKCPTHPHALYLFVADKSVHVWGFKCWDLGGGGQVFKAIGGFWVTIALLKWGAVTVCLFDLEPRGAKHRCLWGLQVLCCS